ncbi:MAG: hypothetical protein K1060chlam1_01304 [Candidatus Anoxychlamydiales bacterium]|nr:hypothetical protein [Candidatus Anoxychlamydiales bacterium]
MSNARSPSSSSSASSSSASSSSSSNASNEILEMNLENYIPKIFTDLKGRVVSRIFTHLNCSQSASYAVFAGSKDKGALICPFCKSQDHRIELNKRLNEAISNFIQNFNLQGINAIASSYNLANIIFEEAFKNPKRENLLQFVTKICRRALVFQMPKQLESEEEIKESEGNQNSILITKKLRELAQKAGIISDRKPGPSPVQTLLISIDDLEELLKKTEEELKQSKEQTRIIHLTQLISTLVKKIVDNKNQAANIYLSSAISFQIKANALFNEGICLYKSKIRLVEKYNEAEKKLMLIKSAENQSNIGHIYMTFNKSFIATKHFGFSISIIKKNSRVSEELSPEISLLLESNYLNISKACFSTAEKRMNDEKYLTAKNYFEYAKEFALKLKDGKEKHQSYIAEIDQRIFQAEMYHEISLIIKQLKEQLDS